jgi:hypothetical protein
VLLPYKDKDINNKSLIINLLNEKWISYLEYRKRQSPYSQNSAFKKIWEEDFRNTHNLGE